MRAAKSRKGNAQFPDACALMMIFTNSRYKGEFDRNKERANELISLVNGKLKPSFMGPQRQTAASCLILSENAPLAQFALSLSRLENIIE
jgi:hypothetical protein